MFTGDIDLLQYTMNNIPIDTEFHNAFNKVFNLVIVAVDVTDTDNVINLDNSLPKVMTLLDVTVNETNLDTIFDIVAALVTTTLNAFV